MLGKFHLILPHRYAIIFFVDPSEKGKTVSAAVVKLADTRDLKSLGSDAVPVRVRPAAPKRQSAPQGVGCLFRLRQVRTCLCMECPSSTWVTGGTLRTRGDIGLPSNPVTRTLRQTYFFNLVNSRFVFFISENGQFVKLQIMQQNVWFT